MPAVSKAQFRKMFALEREGKVAPGTAKHWAHATPDYQALPEHVGQKAASSYNVPQLMAAIIAPMFSQSQAPRRFSAPLQQALEKVGQSVPHPSIFAAWEPQPAQVVGQSPGQGTFKAAGQHSSQSTTQVLNSAALAFTNAARRLKRAAESPPEQRISGCSSGHLQQHCSNPGEGSSDTFLLPSGVRVASRAKAAAIAAMGFGPTTPPAMLPVPGMPAQAPMQPAMAAANIPAPQGLTPGAPQNLGGHSAINSTIQKKGPISTTGDFANPNAGQDVQKFAHWKSALGLFDFTVRVGN